MDKLSQHLNADNNNVIRVELSNHNNSNTLDTHPLEKSFEEEWQHSISSFQCNAEFIGGKLKFIYFYCVPTYICVCVC